MPHTILVTAPKLGAAGTAKLEAAGCRVLYLTGTKDAAEVAAILAAEPVDAVISRTYDLPEAAMRACPTLKVVTKHGVGVSNIDLPGATRLGIPVYVTPGANSQSVAELAIGLMLAAARRIAWMDHEVKAGRWSRAQDGQQLAGRTLGLVGFGQIGQRTAAIAMAMGMKAVAYDPALAGPSPLAGVEIVPTLEDLLPRANVLSLHVPLTDRTRGMIGRAQFERMPPRAILVNTARGPVVNEPDLVAALRDGLLHGAGLDTTMEEPLPPGSPLLGLANVVITPHVGASTPDALEAVSAIAADNVLGYLGGRPPDPAWCFNPEVLAPGGRPP